MSAPSSAPDSEKKAKRGIRAVEISSQNTGIKIRAQPENIEDIEVDILAVHGIGVDPEETHKYYEPSAKSGERKCVDWLSDKSMLLQAVPNVRIMTFGYNSVWYGKDPVKITLEGVAKMLLKNLRAERRKCLDRPLILIGHCFGGLVVQEAYCLAKIEPGDYPGIYDSITGTLFLGTPHQGSHSVNKHMGTQSQIFKAIARYQTSLRTDLEPNALQSMAHDNEALIKTVYCFTRDVNNRKSPPTVFCFYEEKKTPIGLIAGLEDGELELVVNQSCGILNGHQNGGLDSNHFNMNKFQNSNDNNYKLVKEEIWDMCEKSRKIMDERRTNSSNQDSSRPQQTDVTVHKEVPMLPYSIARGFARRDGILEKIRSKFEMSPKVALVGPCGTGKTHVAVEYADTFLKFNPGAPVYWVNASSSAEFEKSYETIMHRLQRMVRKGGDVLPAVQYVVPSLKETWFQESEILLEKNFLKQDTSGNWLLILDGLDGELSATDRNLSNCDPGQRTLQSLLQYIPTGHPYGGKVLITTRSMSLANLAVNHKIAYILEMRTSLSDEDSVSILFGGSLTKAINATSLEYATKISNAVERSAGALALVRAYKQTSSDFAWKAMWNAMQSVDMEIKPGTLDQSMKAAQETETEARKWVRIWNPLQKKLRETHPDAARLLHILCHLEVQGMPLFLLDKHFDDRLVRDQQVAILVRYDMLELSVDKKNVRVTPMIRSCVKVFAGDMGSATESVLALMDRAYPRCSALDSEEYATCKILNVCAAAALRLQVSTIEGKRIRAGLLFKLASYERHVGHYSSAVSKLDESLALREKNPSKGDEKFSSEAKHLLEEIRGLQRKVEKRSSKTRDKSASSAAGSPDLEQLELKPGNAIMSIQSSSELADVREMSILASSLHRQDLAATSNNIANFQGILEWCETKYGANDLAAGRQQYNLASTYDSHGQHEKAEELYQRAIKTVQDKHGHDQPHAECLRIKGSLARMYCEQQRLDKAEPLVREVLDDQCHCLGRDHPDTLTTRLNAALIAQDLRPEELETPASEFEKILAVSQQLLGSDHPLTLSAVSNLALNNRLRGRKAESEKLYRVCLAGYARKRGAGHPDTVTTRLMLAELLEDMGRTDDARGEFKQCLKLGEGLWGKTSPRYKHVSAKVKELGKRSVLSAVGQDSAKSLVR